MKSTFRTPHYALRTGFTLVEMLVIIAIILLLTGILIPAVSMIRQNIKAQLTQSNINLITIACELFKNDFDEYPASTSSTNVFFTTNSDRVGKKQIVLLLTGYPNNPGTKGTPGTTMYDDDGRNGFGFRTVQRGKIYGPYNGTEKIPTVQNSTPPIFADAFGNPILYYRADSTYQFDKDDNNDGGDYPAQPILDQYESPSRPFLIISEGKNESWDESGSSNDDLVNP